MLPASLWASSPDCESALPEFYETNAWKTRGLESQSGGQGANRMNSGLKTSYFGAVALGAVIYYASGVPRVQKDIMQVGSPIGCVGCLLGSAAANCVTEAPLHRRPIRSHYPGLGQRMFL